jgi:hypothetical protein
MSTRSVVAFRNNSRLDTVETKVYRHHDGGPASMIPKLLDFRHVLEELEFERGVQYLAAQFIWYDKTKILRKLASAVSHEDDGHDFTGNTQHDLDPLAIGNSRKAVYHKHGVIPKGVATPDAAYKYLVEISHDPWMVKVIDVNGDGPTKRDTIRLDDDYDLDLEATYSREQQPN